MLATALRRFCRLPQPPASGPSLPRTLGIVLHRIAIRVRRVPIDHEELWVIKWRGLVYCSRIGQPIAQEIDKVGFLLRREPEWNNVGINQRNLIKAIWKIAAAL